MILCSTKQLSKNTYYFNYRSRHVVKRRRGGATEGVRFPFSRVWCCTGNIDIVVCQPCTYNAQMQFTSELGNLSRGCAGILLPSCSGFSFHLFSRLLRKRIHFCKVSAFVNVLQRAFLIINGLASGSSWLRALSNGSAVLSICCLRSTRKVRGVDSLQKIQQFSVTPRPADIAPPRASCNSSFRPR